MGKRLLYIGNKLSAHGNTATSIETLGPLLESEGFLVRYASSRKNKLLRILDMLWTVVRNARRTDYAIIDTYSTSNFWYAFLISQLCRMLKVRYIPTLRGGDLPARLKSSPALCHMLFSNAYLNVAPSGYLMDAFSKAGFSNLRYIPNTIQLSDYVFKIRESVRPKLLWVRSFSPIYNPKMAIDVLVALKLEFQDAELCMVGPDKGGYQKEIVDYALAKSAEVKFTGRLSKPAWRALSDQYDIFINTTHFDNTPVSVIEAMALGLPVVSTNVGGIPFLLEHEKTALLVRDSDTEGMVRAVVSLVSDAAMVKATGQSAYVVASGFDWEAVKRDWLEILK